MSPLNLAAHLGQDEFLAQVLHRRYRHVPAAIQDPNKLITWDDVNTILATHRLEPPRFRLSADGEMLPAHRYTAPVITELLQSASRGDHPELAPALRALAADVA
ncbi:hypothetical protein [Streptomyces sp. 4N124]|uniref:hypothetical protein n=1 Tax=Streptomyces sp. 4N124 TaxID=3457420 RepID=UPI003FD06A0D